MRMQIGDLLDTMGEARREDTRMRKRRKDGETLDRVLAKMATDV